MDNIEAVYTLIVAEADKRLKKDGGDYCGKLVDVSQEVDAKILQLMELTRKKERRRKNVEVMKLMCCTEVLLGEIQNKELKQKDIAQTYLLALRSNEETDWKKVNQAIMERWSISGLKKIKNMAWSGKAYVNNTLDGREKEKERKKELPIPTTPWNDGT